MAINKRIHILSTIPKTEIFSFYDSYCNLVKDNPSKSKYSRIILDNRTKDLILKYSKERNYGGWSNLGYITPNSEDLKNIIDFIHIFMFDLSDDYVGISFDATLSDSLNDELNKLIISDIEEEDINYYAYYIGKKKYITKDGTSKEIIRKQKLDDYLLEIKMRCYDFLQLYFDLFSIDNKAPITLDEYATNYKFLDTKDYFLKYYDFYIFEEEEICKDIDIIINNNDKKYSQTFDKTDFIYSYEYRSNYNRSARILFNLSKKQKDNFFEPSIFLQLYKSILFFYYNIEFENAINKKKALLDTALQKKSNFVYLQYISINQKINIYSSILNNIKYDRSYESYENDRIKKSLKLKKQRYNYLAKENNRLDKDFSNLIMAFSSKESLSLSKISIYIAIISLIVTMLFSIFSYIDQKKNEEPIKSSNLIEKRESK